MQTRSVTTVGFLRDGCQPTPICGRNVCSSAALPPPAPSGINNNPPDELYVSLSQPIPGRLLRPESFSFRAAVKTDRASLQQPTLTGVRCGLPVTREQSY